MFFAMGFIARVAAGALPPGVSDNAVLHTHHSTLVVGGLIEEPRRDLAFYRRLYQNVNATSMILFGCVNLELLE